MSSRKDVFHFKEFSIRQTYSSMKVNTDGVLLGAWADLTQSINVLDIGSGNGIVGLMLAQRSPKIQVTCIDIDKNSCVDAVYNAQQSLFSDRVKVINKSIQTYIKTEGIGIYDHIVSNPPFFTGGTFSINENKNNVRHAVKLPHGDLLIAANRLLNPLGLFSLILPTMEALRFIDLGMKNGLYLKHLTKVYTRPESAVERYLMSFTKTKASNPSEDELTIYSDDNSLDYTKEYIDLTKDFYINL